MGPELRLSNELPAGRLLPGHRPHVVQLALHHPEPISSTSLWGDHLTFQKDRKGSGNMPAMVLTVLSLHNHLHQKPFKCLIMHNNFTCFTKRTK